MSDNRPQTVDRLRRDLAELQATFDIAWKANQRAIKFWQEGHPERALIWPDTAHLGVWLMEQLDDARTTIDHLVTAMAKIRDTWPVSEDDWKTLIAAGRDITGSTR